MKQLDEILQDEPGIYEVGISDDLQTVCEHARGLGFECFYINGIDVTTKQAFLNEIAKSIKFPSYFGHNWDALSDCLQDLAWFPPPDKGYLIIYDHPEVFSDAHPDQFQIALDIFDSSIKVWMDTVQIPMYVLLRIPAY